MGPGNSCEADGTGVGFDASRGSGGEVAGAVEAVAAPRHVAIVMDGNGRWAERNGKLRLSGHNAGMNAMTEIVRHASDSGIKYLTVYAFSTEIWKRDADEVSGIFGLLVKFVELKLRELIENNVVVSVIGDYSPIPRDAKAALERTIENTSGNTGMKFVIALNYGSRADILNAAKRLALEVVRANSAGRADDSESAGYGAEDVGSGSAAGYGVADAAADAVSRLTEADFAGMLSTGGMPDPDLIIRTSGEKRLSNFLLWEAAYSELVFTDVLWPDFTPGEFDRCVGEYHSRVRRFGGRK
ncbi:MAG: di-trans,poly-cis-decaprenylcistransferase [Clostridiales Family XIII bacterium]|jgi:undecaprenyl diphosphate synthase|nr:di-trans,poly-cis-decaprenylcistransferase [Clostridiales Family XIII bacterium]